MKFEQEGARMVMRDEIGAVRLVGLAATFIFGAAAWMARASGGPILALYAGFVLVGLWILLRTPETNLTIDREAGRLTVVRSRLIGGESIVLALPAVRTAEAIRRTPGEGWPTWLLRLHLVDGTRLDLFGQGTEGRVEIARAANAVEAAMGLRERQRPL